MYLYHLLVWVPYLRCYDDQKLFGNLLQQLPPHINLVGRYKMPFVDHG